MTYCRLQGVRMQSRATSVTALRQEVPVDWAPRPSQLAREGVRHWDIVACPGQSAVRNMG